MMANGYIEVLNFILGSWRENFDMLKRKDDKSKAVVIENPRPSDCELVRTSLMPGILKAVAHNKSHRNPIKARTKFAGCRGFCFGYICRIQHKEGLTHLETYIYIYILLIIMALDCITIILFFSFSLSFLC